MRRINAIAVILLAVVCAGLPILHNDSAIPDGVPCSVCVIASARIMVQVPSITAPVPVIRLQVEPQAPAESTEPAAPLASRAPPAA